MLSPADRRWGTLFEALDSARAQQLIAVLDAINGQMIGRAVERVGGGVRIEGARNAMMV